MAIQLDRVVPVGRSFDEYVKMFDLSASDLDQSILSVADGPASFNAEGTKLGYQIQSIDPLYCFTAQQISDRFDRVIDRIIEQIEQSPEDWVWTYHSSPDQLRKNRQTIIQLFSEDYDSGKANGRYRVGELPNLTYRDREYDLGLCSHFLFLYTDHFDRQFHLDSIEEMLRVCQEVRIFPLLTLNLERSPYLEPIVERLETQGYNCQIHQVSYQLQREGNQMLKITQTAS